MKNIDNLKKLKYKEARLQGKSISKSLEDAGYSKATAWQSSSNAIVKHCEQELQEELKASSVSVDMVVKRIDEDRQGARQKGDYSTALRADELLGDYIKMFKQPVTQQVTAIFNDSLIQKLRDNIPLDVNSSNSKG